MKLKNKALTALAAVALAGTSLSHAQVAITNIINTFDAAGSYGGGIGREWGPGAAVFDGATGSPAGAELITVTWDPTSDTPCTAYACNGDGPNPWYNPNPVNLSTYDTLEFDIKYDPTSDITIAQFNDASTWPLTLTNVASGGASVFQSWAGAGQLAAGGSIGGLEINLCGGPGGQMAPVIINTNIPAAAASGWVHISIPINKAQSQIDGVSGIVFHKWCANTWTLATPVSARFWIDNVMLKGTSAPPPPPTVKPLVKATPGLNVFASTAGVYDRQSAVLRQIAGLSWVGLATPANPVTYSFTIAGYPNSPDCEAYLFLAPNPISTYMPGAPDWNETNCAIVYVQGTPNGATMRFRYKVNEANEQAMYSGGTDSHTSIVYSNAPGSWDGVTPNYVESGDLGFVTNNSVLGTWTVKFTSDTNLTLIAPNGNSTSVIFPSYNVGYFSEQTSPAFYVYLGMQANNGNALNQAVTYGNFAISNTASPFSEDFVADSVLDTLTIWNTGTASGPNGVFVAPAGSSTWATWTLPDSGFGLEAATTLNNPLGWASLSPNRLLALNGLRAQLLSSGDVPAGNTAFFRLVKRTFTQLQVLLPGQTNAPGTALGYVGTPTAVSLAAQGLAGTPVTVNACDATWHIVNGVTDQIHLTTSDGSAYPPNSDQALVNGTTTFTSANPLVFQSTGPQTVTATDTTDGTKTPNTSANVTIVP